MKLKNNERYNTIAAYSLIVIAFGLLYALLIFNLKTVFFVLGWFVGKLKCVLYAIFISFLSIPPMRFFDRLLTKYVLKAKRRRTLVRILSVVLTELLILGVILLLILAIIPSLQTSFVELQSVLTPAIDATRNWIESNVKESELLLPFYESLTDYLSRQILSTSDTNSLVSMIAGYIGNIASETSAIFLGLVLSAYALLFRRKISAIVSKILSSILPNRVNSFAFRGAKRTYLYFMEYCSVRVISAVYLAISSLLLCWIFRIPFRSLIAILVFACNLVPQFGGVLITAILPLLLLILNRKYALPLFLILLVLHLFHAIMVEPFLLRKRLRPNIGLAISLAFVFGSIFGYLGFLFAVPIFTSLNAFLQNAENKRLIRRGIPVDDEYFLSLSSVPVQAEKENEPEEAKTD